MKALQIKPDVAPNLMWFDDSPDAGEPSCLCSYCGNVIEEGDGPVRMWNGEGQELRFHDVCLNDVVENFENGGLKP
jgi:hypothetical protein